MSEVVADEEWSQWLAPARNHWLDKGVLNPIVRNQGKCNCCWAIATTSATAAWRKIKMREQDLIQLSCQEIVDCIKDKYPNEYRYPKADSVGCFALTFAAGFQFLIDHGVCKESEYSFVKERQTCRNVETRRMKLEKFERVDWRDANAVREAIDRQPLVCAIKVHSRDANLLNLKKEIYTERALMLGPITYQGYENEEAEVFNHALMIVGYGTENGIDYYLVENSYGEDWGYKGYGKIRCDLVFNIKYPSGEVYWFPN